MVKDQIRAMHDPLSTKKKCFNICALYAEKLLATKNDRVTP